VGGIHGIKNYINYKIGTNFPDFPSLITIQIGLYKLVFEEPNDFECFDFE
jgi:hypothetical protein